MTKRRHISTTARVKLFREKRGICHLCGGKIHVGEEWDVSHAIPLAMGGADDESNWDVAHRRCHRAHTAETDQPQIARAKRIEARHIGAHVSDSPMPFGRRSGLKRKMDGTIIDRRTGEVVRKGRA